MTIDEILQEYHELKRNGVFLYYEIGTLDNPKLVDEFWKSAIEKYAKEYAVRELEKVKSEKFLELSSTFHPEFIKGYDIYRQFLLEFIENRIKTLKGESR